MTYQLNRLH